MHIFLKTLNVFHPHCLSPMAVFLFSIEPRGSGQIEGASYSQVLLLKGHFHHPNIGEGTQEYRKFSECIRDFLFHMAEKLMRTGVLQNLMLTKQCQNKRLFFLFTQKLMNPHPEYRVQFRTHQYTTWADCRVLKGLQGWLKEQTVPHEEKLRKPGLFRRLKDQIINQCI